MTLFCKANTNFRISGTSEKPRWIIIPYLNLKNFRSEIVVWKWNMFKDWSVSWCYQRSEVSNGQICQVSNQFGIAEKEIINVWKKWFGRSFLHTKMQCNVCLMEAYLEARKVLRRLLQNYSYKRWKVTTEAI